MRNNIKYIFIYLCLIGVLVATVLQLAQAQQTVNTTVESTQQPLDQGKLDQMLAPIALYPDTLLSHILIAATYPLEVVQAARWREANADLDEDHALQAADNQDWDASVKALAPFRDLLIKLSDDLTWLQNLGDAFLTNETQVLESVQNLRHKAYAKGNLRSNEYLEVEQEQDKIVIQPVQKEIVYVPYYDTTVVYGDWWWPSYQPIYWRSPRHYAYRSGIYWSPSFHISTGFFFGGVHWANNYVVIDHNYRRRTARHHQPRVIVREYPRWQHNPHHRRGVRYTTNGHQQQQVRVRERQPDVKHLRQLAQKPVAGHTVVRGSVNHQQIKQRLQEHRQRPNQSDTRGVLTRQGKQDKQLHRVQDTPERSVQKPAQRSYAQKREVPAPRSGLEHRTQSRAQFERPSADKQVVGRQEVAPQRPVRHVQQRHRADRATTQPRQGLSRQSESRHRRDTSERK